MLLVKRNPEVLPSLFNELLNWDSWNDNDTATRRPKMNVIEHDECYEIELCVPGIAKEEILLSTDSDNNLVVETKECPPAAETEKDCRRYLRHEFDQPQFKQLLKLPENVKREGITATASNGILRISIPKLTAEEKTALGKTIEIN